MNNILNLFNNNIHSTVDVSEAYQGNYRLDAGHFKGERIFNKIKFTTLNEYCQSIIEPKLFTRIYCKKEYGVPYISSSEMTEIEPPLTSRFISKEFTNNIDQYIIKRGQILVSAAGTVGNVIVAPKYLDGVAGTSDILRIIPKENNTGFIYTYLTSPYGANALSNLSYGAVIKRIRGFQLETLETPQVDIDTKIELENIIQKTLVKREESYNLLSQARKLVLEYNNLPPLDNIEVKTLDPDKETELQLISTEEFTQDYRLDAHFYNPKAKLVKENIRKKASSFNFLSELTDKIFMCNRFKRAYVEKNMGIPFLSGKNITQIRPILKYLSRSETNDLDNIIIDKNWILITRSGTLGRTVFIWNNYENFAASEHLIRVIPNLYKIDGAYLYAFISSDYGYYQLIRHKHGAVIDEITEEQISQLLIPIPEQKQMKEIGDMVRNAYVLRAEAIRLEDKAQEILTQALKSK